MRFTRLILFSVGLSSFLCSAKVDLTIVPVRDAVQITIYNSADLTLVREKRLLTIRKGVNRLQFSWANTLIDPTSLAMKPLLNGDKVEVDALAFPPRTRQLGVWKVTSEISAQIPFEISYFTSGLKWNAFYMATLSKDQGKMRLQGYVRVHNQSGEEYDNAQTRLIVGVVNLDEDVAELARRKAYHDRPLAAAGDDDEGEEEDDDDDDDWGDDDDDDDGYVERKKIFKKALSEYQVYTIEGRETIPNKWSKRLPSFDAIDVPVVNVYRYGIGAIGTKCTRHLSFVNDKVNKLGTSPIPAGLLMLYRLTDDQNHLGFVAKESIIYVPVDKEVKLNLGPSTDVLVEPKRMAVRSENFMFGRRGDVVGKDEVSTYKVTLKNTVDAPVTLELSHANRNRHWEVKPTGEHGKFERIDLRNIRFTVELKAREAKTLTYTVRIFKGQRRQNR